MPSSNASGRGGPADADLRSLERWEADWQREAGRPEAELSTAVPVELEAAARLAWLPRGGRVLDIGCGRGQITAWLAQRGYQAVGMDFSPAAIALAQRHFGSLPGAEFRVGDACAAPDVQAEFDAVVDRNCYHILGRERHRDYVLSVAAMMKDGGHLILFVGVAREGTAANAIAYVKQSFGGKFRVLQSKETAEPLTRSAGPLPRWSLPGLAFHLVRA